MQHLLMQFLQKDTKNNPVIKELFPFSYLKCLPDLKCEIQEVSQESTALSSNVRHFIQIRSLHAARAELIHPQGGFVLKRSPAWVESVIQVVIQQAAQGSHVDV